MIGDSLIRGTGKLSKVGVKTNEIRSLILRRRLQILVHSCIYYKMGESLISDDTWTTWARELKELQQDYPSICERVDYHGEFKDFDPSTGFNLPYGNMEISRKAQQLLDLSKKSIVRINLHKIKSRV